jgi:hypothetical protein
VEQVLAILKNSPTWARENVAVLVLWFLYLLFTILYMALGLPIIVLVTVAVLLQVTSVDGNCLRFLSYCTKDQNPLTVAPKPLERFLRVVITLHIHYPNKFYKCGRRIKRSKKGPGSKPSPAPTGSTGRGRAVSFLDEDDADDEKSDAGIAERTPAGGALLAAGQGGKKKVPKTERIDLSGVWKRVKTENFEALLEAQGAGYVLSLDVTFWQLLCIHVRAAICSASLLLQLP